MTEKVIGYILLALGIVIILLVALNMVGVFTGSKEPYAFMKEEGSILSMDFGVPGTTEMTAASVPVEINNYSQILKIINLVLFVIFSGFFVTVGYKLAMIGANLVRPIVVKTKNDVFKDSGQEKTP